MSDLLVPAPIWADQRGDISGIWPECLVGTDMRFWADFEACGGRKRPSVRRLALTYGWSRSRLRRWMISNGFPPPTRPRGAGVTVPTSLLTHEDLTAKAVRWLRGSQKCPVVLSEFVSAVSIVPDAIGWRHGSECILVECKTSRSDFKADAHKAHVRAGITPGHRRWYLTPPGLVQASEIPDDWGLLEAHERAIQVVKEAPPVKSCFETERAMLCSATRRHQGDKYDWDAPAARFQRTR